jgi:hypothetical protein
MKAFKILRTTTLFTSSPKHTTTTIFRAFFSAEPLTPEPYSQPSDSTFDSSHYEIPISNDPPKPTWNENNRKRVEESLFREEVDSEVKLKIKKEEYERKRRALAKALLEAALNKEEDDNDDDEEADLGMVKEEDQKSLSVGIIGAPNAGKSALTNYMVCFFFSFFHNHDMLFRLILSKMI